MAGEGVRFGVLGPLLVEHDGRPVGLPRSPVLRGLLGGLLLTEGQPLMVGRLAELVWGRRADDIGRSAVQVAVSRLRTWLTARGCDAGGTVTVEHGPAGYRLTVDPDAIDLHRFRDAVARAELAADPAQRCDLLASAFDLVRGPVLADLASIEEGDPLVRAVEETVRDAGLAFGRAALAAGRAAAAVPAVEALAQRRPLDEPVQARLIELLAESGRAPEALRRYERFRAMLADELGVSPSEGVQQAHLAVLARDRDRPRDLDREAGGGAGGGAPAPPGPCLLPPDVADFTGRRAQVERLEALLAAAGGSAVVISAIAGPAGVGKTALAVHWAHRVADRFADGQLYVDLHGYSAGSPLRPIEALASLLRALGVAADDVPVDVDEAAGLYRSLLAGRRMVVVLDNARDAEQVRPLLPGGGGALVLLTSRERLTGLIASHGAQRVTLDVLAPDEAVTLLGRILGRDRVEAEPRAAAALAEACGHLPLALRIAAADLTCFPERSIASHVDQLRARGRLDALQVDGDPSAAVRAAFDCSYAAVDRRSRRLFRLLCEAPGADVGAPAAAALAGGTAEEAERALNRLASLHLLESRRPGRYGFHDLLRLYAAERAEEEDGAAARDAARNRLLAWYLRTADAAARLLYPQSLRLPAPPAGPDGADLPGGGFGDDAGALAWLDAERDNLVATVKDAAARGPRPMAWRLTDALRGFFWRRRHMVDWLATADAALDAAVAERDLPAQAAARLSLGDAAQAAGGYAMAARHYGGALAAARDAGWSDGQAAALGNLGNVEVERGQLLKAADYHARALAHYRRTGRRQGQANTLLNLGGVYRELGRLRDAADHQAKALELYREMGSRSGEAMALHNLAEVDLDLGRLDAATDHLARALDLNRRLGNRSGEAFTMSALAAARRDACLPDQARESALGALALAREIGDQRVEAETLNTLGTCELRLGHPRTAAGAHTEALELARNIGARYAEVEAMLGLAAAQRRAGRGDPRADHAAQALAFARRFGYQVLQGRAHAAIAAAMLDAGDRAQAEAHARQALAVHRETGNRPGEARALSLLGKAIGGALDDEPCGATARGATATGT